MSLGLFFGTWAVIAADIEDALGLGHGGFGALLAVALVGTVTTSTLTGALVERFGTGAVLGLGCGRVRDRRRRPSASAAGRR